MKVSKYSHRRLVYGVGINDADYVIYKCEDFGRDSTGKRHRKVLWVCPFYIKWRGMLTRCYCPKTHARQPTYQGATVCDEWLTFSNFKNWMETQDWEGKQLDKDILIPGNKQYGPMACVFVSAQVNNFLKDLKASGDHPLGVTWDVSSGLYKAFCGVVLTGKSKTLGKFKDPQKAHEAWYNFKLKQAYILADLQTDERVSRIIIERYENFYNYKEAA